jgi:two-component system KDP operon response regulator KdpE
LLVDDEPAILNGLKRQLTAQGYDVRTASNGREALCEIEKNPPELILLDLMMPGVDGLEVTSEVRLRLHSDVPIIVLSAREEEQKKVEALDLGADDYLTKPFGLDELLARMRVALRRVRQESSPPRSNPTTIEDEHLTIDLTRHLVVRDGEEVKLTPKQYDLLVYLAQHRDKLITHRLLLQSAWGPNYSHETQYLHVYIRQLRQKIELDPASPRYIVTEPGLGYRFHLPYLHDEES